MKLPIKFKKEIIAFCKEYQQLAHPRTICVTIPAQKLQVNVWWVSGEEIELADNRELEFNLEKIAEKMVSISKENKKIKSFIKRTQTFGKKHFNNKDWIWNSVLWNYRPEIDETYNSLSIKWVSEKEYNY